MDLILGMSGVAMAFAGFWIAGALVVAALIGAAVVAVFGSLFVLSSRVMRYFS